MRFSLAFDSLQLKVSESSTELQDVEISGTLKGILLETWKFDFLAATGETITGAIGPELSEEEGFA